MDVTTGFDGCVEDMKLQKEWRAHFSAVRDRYNSGQSLVGVDHEQMLHLISNYHPEREAKVGVGISHFFFKDEPYPKTLHLFRYDGSVEDVSWVAAVRAARGRGDLSERVERSRTAKGKSHFREAVVEQIKNAKAEALGLRCQVTGTVLTLENSVVHHDPDFQTLLADWQASRDGTWVEYHLKHAKLLVVTIEAHKQIHYGAAR